MYIEVLGFFLLQMEQSFLISPKRITKNNALENKLKLKKNSTKEMRGGKKGITAQKREKN